MSKKDYIANIENAERRFFDAKVERRQEGEGESAIEIIEGTAVRFNVVTDLGWMKETVLPGAFDDVMNDDIRCLFNHDPNMILARCKEGKGTLRLWVDEVGLHYSYATPDRSYAKDLEDAIRAGDVDQSSYAFRVGEVNWEFAQSNEDVDVRKIVKFSRLYDVSPVTYPASQDTSVAKRSFEALEAEKKEEEKRKEHTTDSFDVFDAQYLFNLNSQ